FKISLPGSVLSDPYWKTWRSKDCKVCWKESWYTAEDLIQLYPNAADIIKTVLKQELSVNQRDGHTYGDPTGITPYKTEDDKWGSAHRVIEEFRMIEEKYMQEYAVTTEGDVPIPELPNPAEKIAWLNNNVPSWQPEYIYQKPERRLVQIVRACAPTVTQYDLLENGPTEIQLGRLEFFWWSCSRHNGENHSIVDLTKDPQIDINYWNSLLINKIQSEGGGGAQWVDREGFKNTQEMERYKRHRNNPRENFETRAGLLTQDGKTPAKPIDTSRFPT
ncbi:unnamed protein product, partial [marine sediment metagenome]